MSKIDLASLQQSTQRDSIKLALDPGHKIWNIKQRGETQNMSKYKQYQVSFFTQVYPFKSWKTNIIKNTIGIKWTIDKHILRYDFQVLLSVLKISCFCLKTPPSSHWDQNKILIMYKKKREQHGTSLFINQSYISGVHRLSLHYVYCFFF